jgi:acyl-CoA reductase-like NAD-dependent aldehyde dehydrogenase
MPEATARSTATSANDVRSYQWYANGQWHDAPGFFDDFEPYTGAVYAHAPNCGAEEAKIAVAAANAAFPAWADTPPVEKARLFLKAADIVRRRREEIAEILARETGSTIPFSTFQQELVAATLQQVAGWVYLPKGEVLASNLLHSMERSEHPVLAGRLESARRRVHRRRQAFGVFAHLRRADDRRDRR